MGATGPAAEGIGGMSAALALITFPARRALFYYAHAGYQPCQASLTIFSSCGSAPAPSLTNKKRGSSLPGARARRNFGIGHHTEGTVVVGSGAAAPQGVGSGEPAGSSSAGSAAC